MQKDLLNYYSTCIFPLKADTESGIFFLSHNAYRGVFGGGN